MTPWSWSKGRYFRNPALGLFIGTTHYTVKNFVHLSREVTATASRTFCCIVWLTISCSRVMVSRLVQVQKAHVWKDFSRWIFRPQPHQGRSQGAGHDKTFPSKSLKSSKWNPTPALKTLRTITTWNCPPSRLLPTPVASRYAAVSFSWWPLHFRFEEWSRGACYLDLHSIMFDSPSGLWRRLFFILA